MLIYLYLLKGYYENLKKVQKESAQSVEPILDFGKSLELSIMVVLIHLNNISKEKTS